MSTSQVQEWKQQHDEYRPLQHGRPPVRDFLRFAELVSKHPKIGWVFSNIIYETRSTSQPVRDSGIGGSRWICRGSAETAPGAEGAWSACRSQPESLLAEPTCSNMSSRIFFVGSIGDLEPRPHGRRAGNIYISRSESPWRNMISTTPGNATQNPNLKRFTNCKVAEHVSNHPKQTGPQLGSAWHDDFPAGVRGFRHWVTRCWRLARKTVGGLQNIHKHPQLQISRLWL